MKPGRFPWALALPVLMLLAWRVAPLASGRDTLFVRDVFNTHLGLQSAKAEAFSRGELPLVDPLRASGQPLLGNLNAAPLYPDGALLLAAPLLWAHNAHFWLHWLLAPFAFYALARGLGLPPPAAWAAATCYALSGWFVSQLSFYNLIAVAALAPALGAATIAAVRAGASPRRRAAALAGVGLLWALLVLAGDPPTALVALGLGLTAPLARVLAPGERRLPPLRRLGAVAAALAGGTLLALPQIAATLAILPASYRGQSGYSEAARTIASFDPRQALEWLVPFAFGRPDVTGPGAFWGYEVYTGAPPFFFTLYPGLLALALVAAAGRPRSAAAWWGWAAAAAGLFVALGRFNPLAGWLFGLEPAAALRYPVKAWLAVAVGASILCGAGFARALGGSRWWEGPGGAAGIDPSAGPGGDDSAESPRGARGLVLGLAVLAVLAVAGWAILSLAPGIAESWLRGFAADLPDHVAAAERVRWAGLAAASAAVAAALAGAAWLARRRPALGAALLLAVHAAAQLALLAPAAPTDEAAAYRRPSPLLAAVPPGSVVAHGAAGGLFGESTLYRSRTPDPGARWLERRAFSELYPVAGRLAGRRFALDVSPEGLDSWFTHLARAAVEEAGGDAERVRLLAAWGADRLVLDREIGEEAAHLVRPLAAVPSYGHVARVYAIRGAAPEVAFVTGIERAPHLNAALAALRHPGFDPRRQVVLPGDPAPVPAERDGGGVRILARGAEGLTAEVDSPHPGALVWRRAWLPLYRASVGGAPAVPRVANLHLLAVEVPAGRHAVRVWADRRPLARSAWGSAGGGLLLALLALGAVRGRW